MPSNFELAQTSVEYDDLDVNVFPYGPVSYSAIDLLPGIPHIDQLEVERLFATGAKTGNTVFTIADRRRMFKLPKNWYTINETNKTISILKFSSIADANTTFNLTTGLGRKYISLNDANTFITIPNLGSNDTIIIRRKTLSEEKLVNFTAGSRLTSGQLNLTSNQLINILQELLWKVDNEVIIKYDKDAIDGPFLGSTGGSFLDVSGNIDMNGQRITNLGVSSLLSDAMSKSEISDAIFRHGVITKDIAPEDIPGAQNDVIEGDPDEGRSGIWFNPQDGKLRAWAGDAWVIVTNAINPAVNPFLVQTNTVQSISGQKTFTAPTILSSTLNVTGATTLSSTLNVTGATTLSSTLNVTGATTLSSTLNVTDATTLSSTLNVTDATTLSSTLNVTGNITTNGKVGIGTSTPDSSLDVNGNVMIRGHDSILNIESNNPNSGSGGSLVFGHIQSDNNTPMASIKGSLVDGSAGSRAGDLKFFTSNTGSLTEKMILTKDGKLGIGVASPSTTIDVDGTLKVGDFGGATNVMAKANNTIAGGLPSVGCVIPMACDLDNACVLPQGTWFVFMQFVENDNNSEDFLFVMAKVWTVPPNEFLKIKPAPTNGIGDFFSQVWYKISADNTNTVEGGEGTWIHFISHQSFMFQQNAYSFPVTIDQITTNGENFGVINLRDGFVAANSPSYFGSGYAIRIA